jgi:glycosyltransferase involved in cell wall biosynthesis
VKVAYVVHRYGAEVVGGAEQAYRSFAERLVAGGWEVEVFTTCARDGADWVDQYPAGTVDVNGVTVYRFPSRAGRDPEFHRLSDVVLPNPAAASVADQQQWIEMQGPVNPDALDAAVAADPDIAVFYPYLYWPTVRGVGRFRGRAVMHPAAHDEAPIRLPLFREVFTAASGLVFQTPSEARMVQRMFPVGLTPQILLGLGVDRSPGEPERFRAESGVGDRPFLLCLGRVDDGKGSTVAHRFFTAYKARHPGPLALVFAGPVVDQPPDHPDVFVTGPVDEAAKWGALESARALLAPSPYESFSIVLMEAWTAGIPILTNAACVVTREHCRRSGGGLWFDGFGSFEAALDLLGGTGGLAADLAQRGLAYVQRDYLWPGIMGRYRAFLSSIAERGAPLRSPA